jgi:hypothetical protein
MRSAVAVFLSGLMALLSACRQSGESDNALRPAGSQTLGTPASVGHFIVAEQNLAVGEYHLAATHLNKGIIAYRGETGKMHGRAAQEANRAIDVLIRFRKNLREGKPVDGAGLHLAIQNALAIEAPAPRQLETRPSGHEGLIVPVGGQ